MSNSLQKSKDFLAKILYKMTAEEAIKSGICIQCGEKALLKCYTKAGREEYRISGLCEKCFDNITLGGD